jgi:hypothetical protein
VPWKAGAVSNVPIRDPNQPSSDRFYIFLSELPSFLPLWFIVFDSKQ